METAAGLMAQPLQAAHQAKDSQSMFSLSPHAPNTRNEYAVLRRTISIDEDLFSESEMLNQKELAKSAMLNLPCRETLLKQLEINNQDMKSTIEELTIHEESEEQNYDVFQDSLTTKRRQLQEKLAEKVVSGAKYHQDQQGNIIANDESSILPTPTTAGASSSVPRSVSQPAISQTRVSSTSSPDTPNSLPTVNVPVRTSQSENSTPAVTPQTETKTGIFSRIFKSKQQENSGKVKTDVTEVKTEEGAMVRSVDDFVPDVNGLDSSFLDDTKEVGVKDSSKDEEDESDEDAGFNPMVANFKDDLDSDDDLTTPVTSKSTSFSAAKSATTPEIDISSDDEGPSSADVPVVAQDADLSSEGDMRSNKAVNTAAVDVTDSDENIKQERPVQKHKQKAKSITKSEGKEVKKIVTETSKKRPVIDSRIERSSAGEDNSDTEVIPTSVQAKPVEKFHLEIPQEDLGNWLDQFEEKSAKPAKNKVPIRETTALESESDDEASVRVKPVSSDVEEASVKSSIKKKKKKTDDKSEDKVSKKHKKKKDKDKGKESEGEKKKKRRRKRRRRRSQRSQMVIWVKRMTWKTWRLSWAAPMGEEKEIMRHYSEATEKRMQSVSCG
ncbi:hypothetical protein C0Q70_18249 [Pomacea canaliculata]|uniref:Uncharacterized protein n=1 Tax=Pomacea canaliculata TaxID=400727 RepID=A0A2T7NMM9_POMCA|nr:hypothetical protein C0Q70_18249 [Pomacea canaliculata]